MISDWQRSSSASFFSHFAHLQRHGRSESLSDGTCHRTQSRTQRSDGCSTLSTFSTSHSLSPGFPGGADLLSACSSGSTSSSASSPAASSSAAPMSNTMSTTSPADPAGNLVGTGCTAYAQQVPTGPGSVAGMAQDPVAVAASNNPMLTTLTSALSGKLNPNVNLVDTLDSGQYPVFARPTSVQEAAAVDH